MTAFLVVDAASGPARRTLRQYLQELQVRVDPDLDPEPALLAAARDLNPPHGLFVVAEDESACGGVHFLDQDRGEVKRMWVAPSGRGRGIATALLAHLEQLVRESGRSTVVLDTNSALTEALALYERHGYRRVDAYNDNPHAHHWFRKDL